MDDETKAALERTLRTLDAITIDDESRADAALIRAHIASETNAHDAGYAAAVADVVAWLRRMEGRYAKMMAPHMIAGSVEAGEHVGAAKGGDDA